MATPSLGIFFCRAARTDAVMRNTVLVLTCCMQCRLYLQDELNPVEFIPRNKSQGLVISPTKLKLALAVRVEVLWLALSSERAKA
jgi:hypothetical protein